MKHQLLSSLAGVTCAILFAAGDGKAQALSRSRLSALALGGHHAASQVISLLMMVAVSTASAQPMDQRDANECPHTSDRS